MNYGYYGFQIDNDYRSYLEHKGVKGMRWHVKRGQQNNSSNQPSEAFSSAVNKLIAATESGKEISERLSKDSNRREAKNEAASRKERTEKLRAGKANENSSNNTAVKANTKGSKIGYARDPMSRDGAPHIGAVQTGSVASIPHSSRSTERWNGYKTSSENTSASSNDHKAVKFAKAKNRAMRSSKKRITR